MYYWQRPRLRPTETTLDACRFRDYLYVESSTTLATPPSHSLGSCPQPGGNGAPKTPAVAVPDKLVNLMIWLMGYRQRCRCQRFLDESSYVSLSETEKKRSHPKPLIKEALEDPCDILPVLSIDLVFSVHFSTTTAVTTNLDYSVPQYTSTKKCKSVAGILVKHTASQGSLN